MKELKVSAIKEGSVIDHIPSSVTFKVAEILSLENIGQIVSIATNLDSSKLGKKGIIKIGGKILTEKEANKIALIAPEATLSIIRDFKVINKSRLTIQKELVNIVKCFNPNCITNTERVKTLFHVLSYNPLRIRCNYCERTMNKEDIILK